MFSSPNSIVVACLQLRDGGVLYALERVESGRRATVKPTWKRAGCGELEISFGKVHVWRANLDTAHDIRMRLLSALSENERAVARKLKSPHAEHFVVTRGVLRHIFAGYLKSRPREIQFSNAENPAGEFIAGGTRLCYDVQFTCSSQIAVYAISAGPAVALGLQELTPGQIPSSAIKRVLSDSEIQEWLALPRTMRPEAFYMALTAKSALRRATQREDELRTFPIEFHQADVPGSVRIELGLQPNPGFSLRPLEPAPDCVGAVVVKAEPQNISLWEVEHLQYLCANG